MPAETRGKSLARCYQELLRLREAVNKAEKKSSKACPLNGACFNAMRKVQATDRRAFVVLQEDAEVRERQEFDMIQFVELLASVFALGFGGSTK
jgi:hypothetical protein